MSSSQFRRGKRRFDDDESTFLKRDRHRRRLPPADFGSETFGCPRVTGGPRGISPRPRSAVRNRTRTGLSPTSRPSTPSSAS